MAFPSHFGDHINVRQVAANIISVDDFKKYAVPLVQAEERLEYKPGQIVFYEGHKSYGVYVLRRGRIRLFQKKEDIEKLIRVILPNFILGVDEVREGRVFEFGAKAETDVSVSFFGSSIFRETATQFRSSKSNFGKGIKKKL